MTTLKELIEQAQRQHAALRDHAFGTPEDFMAKAALLELMMPLAGKAGEAAEMLKTLEIFTRCRCESGWTDRDLHAPECIFDEVPELADWLRANGYGSGEEER